MPRKYYNSDFKAVKAERDNKIVASWEYLKKSAGVAFNERKAADAIAKEYGLHSGRISIYRILREKGIDPFAE